MTLTDNHKNPLSNKYILLIEVVSRYYNKSDPISERVKPKVVSVSRGGKVLVTFSPKFKTTELPLKLNN
jgi:hypothetical protein